MLQTTTSLHASALTTPREPSRSANDGHHWEAPRADPRLCGRHMRVKTQTATCDKSQACSPICYESFGAFLSSGREVRPAEHMRCHADRIGSINLSTSPHGILDVAPVSQPAGSHALETASRCENLSCLPHSPNSASSTLGMVGSRALRWCRYAVETTVVGYRAVASFLLVGRAIGR